MMLLKGIVLAAIIINRRACCSVIKAYCEGVVLAMFGEFDCLLWEIKLVDFVHFGL